MRRALRSVWCRVAEIGGVVVLAGSLTLVANLQSWIPLTASAHASPALGPGSAGGPGIAGVRTQSIAYRLEKTPERIDEEFDSDQIAVLEMLNRVDRERLQRLEDLVVPADWSSDRLDYSPFPATVDSLRDFPKALLVHQPVQAFAAYENGRLVRWGPVSTGREVQPTPSGRFHLNWRSRGRHSTVNPEWYLEWYFNFHNERGLSFHQYALPGEPASHACVRLLERDARWIYEWGEGWTLDEREWEVLEAGTPVWILGEYDFDANPVWRDATDLNPAITDLDTIHIDGR